MDKKIEMLERLTGIRSSRKNYYVELTELVQEMQIKNKQLEIRNQLIRIHVNMSWEEVTEYIAFQLHQMISFDQLVLTLVEKSSLSLFMIDYSSGTPSKIVLPWRQKEKLSPQQLDEILAGEFRGHVIVTVLLQSHTDHSFGFLTMMSKQSFKAEELEFFRGMVDYAGIAIENILLYKDVCEKVKIEAQLIQSAKLAAIGEMAAGVAHELNSPLTAILGNTQLLLREFQEERQTRMLEGIYQCGLRSKKIIQNLLTFSRQDEYIFEDLDVHDLVEDVCGLIGYQLKVSGIIVDKRFQPDLPKVKGSRYQIEQVLINLLLNARDAAQHQEHPTIQIETLLTEVESVLYVGISVKDNGIGIKQEYLPDIFNPFFTTKADQKGTGLGLSVSLGIAESHKGKILVESSEGEYSRFTFLLPIPKEEEIV
ncbi:MAG TPA: ATP-binding protein [Bacillota bacterium]|nr:ATP-binding protein [Bacillota bacterium]